MTFVDLVTTSLDARTVLIFLAVLLVTYVYLEWKKVCKMPPGPTGIPFLGYGPLIDQSKPFWRLSQDLSKRYNSDITSINLFGTTVVFLTSREVVKEAFQKRHDMADRPKNNFFKTLDPTHEGLIASSGQLWKEQRRFALLMLRDFGMGKIAAEQSIQDEAVNLCEHFQSLGGSIALDPLDILGPAVSNIICAIGFGKRFSYDDHKFREALNAMNFLLTRFTTAYARIVLSKNLRWLVPLFYSKTKRETQEKYDLISEFIRGMIADHKRRFDGSVNNLIDGFLLEQSQQTGSNHYFTDGQLRHVIFDLFFAGSETTTTTLRWALLYLIKYLDIQERIYDEVVSIIGTDRVPNMSDRKSTPYTEAFLLEIQRFNTIVPLSVVHSCAEELTFMGYTIPAESVIFSNLAVIHRDPKDFNDPDIFRSERFLDGNNKVINFDKLDQFGIGRRACAGEALARMEIYIFFTTMVQRLQFVSANQTIDLDRAVDGAISAPKSFLLHAILRH